MISEPHFALESEFPLRLQLLRRLGHQYWMRGWISRGRDRLMRMLHDPSSKRSYLFEVDFFGKRYRGDLARYMDWAVFCHGSSGGAELGLLRAAADYPRSRRHRPITFFDVGANVGQHSLFMAGFADRVVAFEPSPRLLGFFEEHVSLNNLQNVEIVPVALGDKDEILPYYPGPIEDDTIGTFLKLKTTQHAVPQNLPVRNGDRLFEEKQYPPIDIMKVDVEGFEPSVFRGLKGRIRCDRPIILSEVTQSTFGSESDFRECFYQDAVFANVRGRSRSTRFTLHPFVFRNGEVLVIPCEMADFTQRLIARH